MNQIFKIVLHYNNYHGSCIEENKQQKVSTFVTSNKNVKNILKAFKKCVF